MSVVNLISSHITQKLSYSCKIKFCSVKIALELVESYEYNVSKYTQFSNWGMPLNPEGIFDLLKTRF